MTAPIEVTRADRERAEHCLRIPRDPHPVRVDIVAHWSVTGEWPRQVDFASLLVRDTIREHESVAQAIAEARAEGAAKKGAELHAMVAQASRNYAELESSYQQRLSEQRGQLLDIVQALLEYAQHCGDNPLIARARALLEKHGCG